MEEDPSEFDDESGIRIHEEMDPYESALLILLNESKICTQLSEESGARFEAKSGGKWISKNVRFDIQDCTLPLQYQANVFAPGGTGAKLENYKQRKVLVEDRRRHRIVWTETYVSAACVRRTLAEPFQPAEMSSVFEIMRSVANSAYCESFTY